MYIILKNQCSMSTGGFLLINSGILEFPFSYQFTGFHLFCDTRISVQKTVTIMRWRNSFSTSYIQLYFYLLKMNEFFIDW